MFTDIFLLLYISRNLSTSLQHMYCTQWSSFISWFSTYWISQSDRIWISQSQRSWLAGYPPRLGPVRVEFNWYICICVLHVPDVPEYLLQAPLGSSCCIWETACCYTRTASCSTRTACCSARTACFSTRTACCSTQKACCSTRAACCSIWTAFCRAWTAYSSTRPACCCIRAFIGSTSARSSARLDMI